MEIGTEIEVGGPKAATEVALGFDPGVGVLMVVGEAGACGVAGECWMYADVLYDAAVDWQNSTIDHSSLVHMACRKMAERAVDAKLFADVMEVAEGVISQIGAEKVDVASKDSEVEEACCCYAKSSIDQNVVAVGVAGAKDDIAPDGVLAPAHGIPLHNLLLPAVALPNALVHGRSPCRKKRHLAAWVYSIPAGLSTIPVAES